MKLMMLPELPDRVVKECKLFLSKERMADEIGVSLEDPLKVTVMRPGLHDFIQVPFRATIEMKKNCYAVLKIEAFSSNLSHFDFYLQGEYRPYLIRWPWSKRLYRFLGVYRGPTVNQKPLMLEDIFVRLD